MTAPIPVWMLAASVLVGGCVSGGNVLSGDRHFTWLDDGAMMIGTSGKATWASTAGRDSIDMLGINDRAAITIYAATPTPLTPQTFVCGQTTSGQLGSRSKTQTSWLAISCS